MYTHNLHIPMFQTKGNSKREQVTAQAGKPSLLHKLWADISSGLLWALEQLSASHNVLTATQQTANNLLIYNAACYPEFFSVAELYYYSSLPDQPTPATDASIIEA